MAKIFNKQRGYLPVSRDEDDTVEKEQVDVSYLARLRAVRWPSGLLVCFALSGLLNLGLLAILVLPCRFLPSFLTSTCHIPSDFLAAVDSPASPALSYNLHRFMPRIMGISETSKYQLGTDEADTAWKAMYDDIRGTRISKAEAAHVHTHLDHIPDEPDQYVVTLDVVHQLHCLDMLRMLIWPEKYAELLDELNRFGTGDEGKIRHMDHCVESIRQTLQCSSDVTPIPWRLDPTEGELVPVLGASHHRCRDWDALHKWAMDRQYMGGLITNHGPI